MNRLIRIGILWCLAIATGRAQEAAKFKEASQAPTLETEEPSPLPASEVRPVNGQPSPFRPLRSEPPRRVAEPKRIVIQPGVDAQESEVAMQFMADLEKAGIAKIDKTKMTPTLETPTVVQFFMREDESFEKIKRFLVDLRASGVEKLVLEFGGSQPEDYADKQHNSLVFLKTRGYPQDDLQRLEKVIQAAAERCGLSLYLAGSHVLPSRSDFLRTDYEVANKQAHDLAESLRQTPDAAKKAELRTVVHRAFTARQSLLRAELQVMQARLAKTHQSLDMRDRMADQIVDRRVEDLLNPELKWDNKVSSETTGETAGSATSTANASPKLETTAPVKELEGDWHWVSGTDSLGKAIEVSPYNVSFKSDICTIAFQGGQFDRRVRVDPDSTRIFGFMDNRAFLADNYRIEGDQLTLSGDGVTMVYQRGHIARPKSIPNATEEQKSRWRSGIVDIYWEHQTQNETRQDPVGTGVVISPKGMVICQVPEEIQSERDSKTKFIVRFDDGGFAYTTIVEEADHGWLALQPTQPCNHQFQVSTLPMSVGDQVHLWACASGGPPSRITVDLAKVILLDRQATTANTSVCQLTRPIDFRAHSCPVLSGDGELLAITLRGTGDLVLAVSVAELKTMFPKSFGPATQVATELEGDWHLVAATDAAGKPVEFKPTNLIFKNDQYTLAYQGGQIDRRVEVYPDSKEIRYFNDDSGFVQEHYLLEGDQLTGYNENRRYVYQRGHVALPKTIPKATDEQKSRWRSGIVEILGVPSADKTWAPQLIGYGVIISPQMRIVSQTRLFDADSAFFAKFDDGGVVPLKIVEKGSQGWLAFEPEQAIEANHTFRLSKTSVGQHDEVNFWVRATVGESPKLRLSKTTVSDLERKSPALGHTVWQLLFQHNRLDGSLPILDADGDLLAITVIGSNELLLAVPVSQLKTMFPKSFGAAAQVAE